MLTETGLIDGGTLIVASAVGGVTLAHAVHGAPWRAWLGDRERQWVWFASMAMLLVVWPMQAGITPGLSVRFVLLTALTLMHGWRLALVAGALVLAMLSQAGLADWINYGPNLLCMVVVPVLFTVWWHERIHDHLPRNYFIYFFVTTFLGSALAFNCAGLMRLALVAASGHLDMAHVGPEYFAILPFMSLGEAVANGMIVATAVVFRPQWVMSFDDRLYLFQR